MLTADVSTDVRTDKARMKQGKANWFSTAVIAKGMPVGGVNMM